MKVLLVYMMPAEAAAAETILPKVLPQAELFTARCPEEALEYARADPAAAVLIGLQAEPEQALALAGSLRKQNSRINVILCAANADFAMQAWDLNCSAYLLLPLTEEKLRGAMDSLRYPVPGGRRVRFRCFGNFEVSCDGAPIVFKYNRTRELLAYLVDRNGALCSIKELTSVLFEDDQHRSYMYQLRLDLLNTMSALGVSDVLKQSRGYLGICRDRVDCDYYDYLDRGTAPPIREYMTQYSFSEQTFAALFMPDQI